MIGLMGNIVLMKSKTPESRKALPQSAAVCVMGAVVVTGMLFAPPAAWASGAANERAENIPHVVGASAALSPEEVRRNQVLDEAQAKGLCPHREDIEGVRRQMAAEPEKARFESERGLLRKICGHRGYGIERQAQIRVFGASADGLPIDLAVLKALELCTRTQCQPIPLLQKSGGVMSNARGDATLIARGEIAGGTLVGVRVTLRGEDGRERVQAMNLAHRVDALRLRRDALVLVSLQAGSGCAGKPCLTLRHAVAESAWNEEGSRGEAHTVHVPLVYNPAEGLQRDLGHGVSLSIPPGALDEPRLLLPVVSVQGRMHPWPEVTFQQVPVIRFGKKMQITLRALPSTPGDRDAAPAGAGLRAEHDAGRAATQNGWPGAGGEGEGIEASQASGARQTHLETDTTYLLNNKPAGDARMNWRQAAPIRDECYLRPSDSDCNYRFMFDEMARQTED